MEKDEVSREEILEMMSGGEELETLEAELLSLHAQMLWRVWAR